MLIISNKGSSGINSFFPLLVKGRREVINVLDWTLYKRLLPSFVILNVAFVTCFAGLLFHETRPALSEHVFAAANILLFLYSAIRVRFCRRIVSVSQVTSAIKRIAPPLVWIDYMTTGAMFLLMSELALREESEQISRFLIHGFQLVFLIYAALPVLNYLQYASEVRRP